jgi:hypothetical protein
MTLRQVSFRSRISCKFHALLLAFSWCAGLVVGTWSSWRFRSAVVDVFRDAVLYDHDFLNSLAVASMPFLLTSIGLGTDRCALYVLGFLKGSSFGFCGRSLGLAFGTGNWILWPMFLFVDLAVIPVCYFCWLRLPDATGAGRRRALYLCLLYSAVVAMVDHFFISSFLISVIQ